MLIAQLLPTKKKKKTHTLYNNNYNNIIAYKITSCY